MMAPRTWPKAQPTSGLGWAGLGLSWALMMSNTEWVDWWLQTDYGRRSKIKWDSTRHTAIWEYFDQVAHSTDGAPKVMCRRCAKILEHPYTMHTNAEGKEQYHGTSTMTKHLKTISCRNTKNGKNAEIKRFLQNGVCYTLTSHLL